MFPKISPRTIGLVAVLALIIFSAQLRADFIPPYDVPTGFIRPFTLSSGSVTPDGSWSLHVSGDPLVYGISLVQTDPSQVLLMTGAAVLHGTYSLDLQFTHAILGTGTLSFDYSLSLREPAEFGVWNYGGYVLDGILTQLPAGTGFITLPVRAGDIFGFEAFAFGNCFACGPGGTILGGASTLTITNFAAPVPEPTTTALLICAGSGVMLLRARARGRFLRTF